MLVKTSMINNLIANVEIEQGFNSHEMTEGGTLNYTQDNGEGDSLKTTFTLEFPCSGVIGVKLDDGEEIKCSNKLEFTITGNWEYQGLIGNLKALLSVLNPSV